MTKEKLDLKDIKNVLSRAEMKKIMAGSDGCQATACGSSLCTQYVSGGYYCNSCCVAEQIN
jgi:hypothetical protein